MAFIHGGGFKSGDSSELMYGPDYLLAKDIVFVSMNYRLGVLGKHSIRYRKIFKRVENKTKLYFKGFLSIDDPSVEIPGNAGLKDQSMALRWIRNNIHAFGGDCKNITVFGSSAGAGSLHLHMISDLSKGLFDKAIIQSGSALAPWCNIPRKNWSERIAKKLGWDGEGGAAKLVEFLRSVDVEELILAQEVRTDEEKQNWMYVEWGPIIEPYASEQSFIVNNPIDLHKTSWSNEIPLIIGGTTDEGLLCHREIVANLTLWNGEKAFENVLPQEWNLTDEKTQQFAQILKHVYVEDGPSNKSEALKFLDILSDKFFWHSMHSTIVGRVQTNAAATYMYRYAFVADAKISIIRQVMVPRDVRGIYY